MNRVNTLNGKRILVTGGGGFIGSHLLPRLLDAGAEVTVAAVSAEPPWRLAAYSGAYLLATADIADKDAISAVFASVQPHAVVHLAAYGVDSAMQDVSDAACINVLGMANVLSAMKASGCRRIVALGSSSEYGNHDGLISEDTPLRPENIYGSTKAAATTIAHQYAPQNDIGIVTLRPFGVYGEAEPPHKLFCHAILKMLRNEDLELTPCKQQRDYCYAGDIAEAIIASLKHESLRNNIFNLGSGETHTLHHYIEALRRIIAPSSQVIYGALAYRTHEIWAPTPDIRRARERLGWQSTHDLQTGLEKTAAWFRENIHHYTQN